MKTLIRILMAACLAVSALSVAPAYGKSIQKLHVPKKFDYSTQRTVPVKVSVVLPAGKVAAVAFFAQDKRRETSTQLLTGLTEPGGAFQGKLEIPAAVRDILITVRYEGWIQETRVIIRKNRPINQIIVMPS